MVQPDGCVVPGQENKVCKLVKSLYGLKQAPKYWHEKLDQVLLSGGFSTIEVERCVYYTKLVNNDCVIICLYVDDMLIASKSLKEMDVLKKGLHQTFDMKDLGHASHILGMCITRDRNQHLLYLSQEEYIDKVLHRFHMEGGKTISTPSPPHVKLSAKDSPQIDSERAEMAKIPYASACMPWLLHGPTLPLQWESLADIWQTLGRNIGM